MYVSGLGADFGAGLGRIEQLFACTYSRVAIEGNSQRSNPIQSAAASYKPSRLSAVPVSRPHRIEGGLWNICVTSYARGCDRSGSRPVMRQHHECSPMYRRWFLTSALPMQISMSCACACGGFVGLVRGRRLVNHRVATLHRLPIRHTAGCHVRVEMESGRGRKRGLCCACVARGPDISTAFLATVIAARLGML